MYVRGGYNVYPVEVEAVLSEHPDVAAVAVVPRAGPGDGRDRRRRGGPPRPGARPRPSSDLRSVRAATGSRRTSCPRRSRSSTRSPSPPWRRSTAPQSATWWKTATPKAERQRPHSCGRARCGCFPLVARHAPVAQDVEVTVTSGSVRRPWSWTSPPTRTSCATRCAPCSPPSARPRLVRELVEARIAGQDRRGRRALGRTWSSSAGPRSPCPKSAGGLGLGAVELAVVVEELGPGDRTRTAPPDDQPVRPGRPRARRRPTSRSRSSARSRPPALTGTLAITEATGSFDPGRGHRDRDPGGDGSYTLDRRQARRARGAGRDRGRRGRPRRRAPIGDDGVGAFVVPADALDASRPSPALDPSRLHRHRHARRRRRSSADRVLGSPGPETAAALRTRRAGSDRGDRAREPSAPRSRSSTSRSTTPRSASSSGCRSARSRRSSTSSRTCSCCSSAPRRSATSPR